MTGLAIGAACWAGLVALAFWLCRAGDQALADLGPTSHDQVECDVCLAATDAGAATRIDMDLWAAELRSMS